jgi:hypothetical protein
VEPSRQKNLNGIHRARNQDHLMRKNSDSLRILICSGDNYILQKALIMDLLFSWDVASGKIINEELAQTICLASSPDNKILSSGNDDNNLKLRGINDGNFWKDPLK